MTLWTIFAILLLVLANGFFVAAEFGLVAVRRTRIEELVERGSRRAASAQKAIRELNLMLSGCQLGITLASLGLGWIGEPTLAFLLGGAFDALPPPFDAVATHAAAVVVAFGIITFLHVALGELVPKNLAIALPEATALWVASPIRAFTYLLRPVIWFFNESANRVLRLFGIKAQPEVSSVHTPEELAIIIEESRRGGAIESGQSELLAKTLEFPEKRAVEAMVPRVAARAVKADAGLDVLLDLAEATGYSRFPVWEERPDEFMGVVHLKDMIKAGRRRPDAAVREVMRKPLLVPESLPLEDVLVQMRISQAHFAIVLDEFGSTAGIITLEDILEELVGQIRDEYDLREKPELRRVKDAYRVPGTMRPDELSSALGFEIPEGDYETVAGFILKRLGRLARRGDEVSVDGWTIRVANVRRRRILSVDVRRAKQATG
ncbi:MAG: hemolysin family protein [Candidatus Methylomirabilales bacterium]